jgi:parallel beta-helix repeat protein/predicted outer membrane repeat protein
MPPLNIFEKSIIAIAIASSVAGQTANSATIDVDTPSDVLVNDLECSLREAIISANTNPGNTVSGCVSGTAGLDTITFASMAQTYELTISSPLIISEAIYIDGYAATIDALGTNPAFDVLNSSLSLYNLDVVNGYASGAITTGGAIKAVGSDITLNDVELKNNTATVSGGAVYLGSSSTMIVTNSTFSENQTTAPNGSGGAIFLNGSNVELRDSTLDNNSANSLGGAIGATNGSTITIEECTFSGNNAENTGGGAIFVGNGGFVSNVDINRSAFENNTAIYGGALYFGDYSKASISDTTLSNNIATKGGGGMYLYDSSDARLTNTTIFANIAQANLPGQYTLGGGISMGSSESKLRIVNSTITGNSAVDSGGGLAVQIEANASVVNTIISGNTADVNANEVYTRTGGSINSRSNILGSDASTNTQAFAGGNPATDFNPSSSDIVATADGENIALGDMIKIPSSSKGNIDFFNLLPDSPAISAASSSVCPPLGVAFGEREQDSLFVLKTANSKVAVIGLDGDCDIGAVEFTPKPL